MEQFESVIITTYEGEQHVIAAAQQILKALEARRNVSDDLRKTLLDLEIHLSAKLRLTEGDAKGFKELKRQLNCAESKIMSWEEDPSMIWDSGLRESSEYLRAIDEIQTLIQNSQGLCVSASWKQKELLQQRAHGVLQIAMSRLEEELVHILVQHKQYFESQCLSSYNDSYISFGDEIDLLHPDILPDLKSIANAMFASKYHQEFCQAFITSRRHALDEYFVILGMEKLSIENVTKMEWGCLNIKIKQWIRAMKIIVQVYLASEKKLCEQILGHFGSVHQFCFSEISQSFMLHLFMFGEAITMGTHTPEKLFCFLDMCEVLENVTADVDLLFLQEGDSIVRSEFHKLLRIFGDTTRSTFQAFENAIATNPSANQFPGGGVHHLTKYVMNYIKTLAEYSDTLNNLLPNNGHDTSAITFSPMAGHFRSITTTLEINLSHKSKLYKNEALQHIFMMNNIHYMVQKVKDSELSPCFGDEWLRWHVGKFQNNARSYERVTWSSVLSMLRDNCLLNCASKASLKKRCTDFSIAFEEVYRAQTGWLIPDPLLREDLQISISQKVVHSYRTFMGRNSSKIRDKWIKFNADDLGSYILDLFEGSSRSCHNHWLRK